MKTIPPALQSKFAGDAVTNAICWAVAKITGGFVRGTEHDRDITISSGPLAGTYRTLANISGSDVRSNSDMAVDNMEVQGAEADDSADGITFAEIHAGVLDGAKVTVFLCDWTQPNAGQVILRRGYMGDFRLDSDYRTDAEVRGLAQLLSQQIGRVLSDRCDVARFGDSRCKFDVSTIQATGTVSAVESNRSFTVTFDPGSPTWARLPGGGEILFNSGFNSGFEKEVRRVTESYGDFVIELFEEMADDVIVGDTLRFTPGCDRLYSTCKNLYDNLINFRGHGVFVPGALKMMSGASVTGDCNITLPDGEKVVNGDVEGGGGGEGGGDIIIATGDTVASMLGSYAIGGEQNYQTTAVKTALARRKVNIVAHYPGWQNSRGTTMAQVMADVKAESDLDTLMFIYMIYSDIPKSDLALYEMIQYIAANNLYAYTNGLTETGRLESDFSSSQWRANYTLGGKLVGGKRLYQKFIDWHIGVSLNGVGASNGSTVLAAAPNPNCNGFFFDNVFYRERVNADYNRDGALDGVSSVASVQAIQNSHAAAIDYYRSVRPGDLLLANSADWHEYETHGYGNFSDTVLNQKVDGGAIESIHNYPSFDGKRRSIATQMNAYKSAKLGIMGWDIGSFTNYQSMRYGLGIALLTGAYYYPFVGTYRSQDLPNLWFDENEAPLGARMGAVPTTAWQQAGDDGEGIWRADFEDLVVLVAAERASGSAPYSTVNLGGSFLRLSGSQDPVVNNGATVTTWPTPAAGDAILLKRIP